MMVKIPLTCIDCGRAVGTLGDKNVPVRCKECMDRVIGRAKEKGSGSGESSTV